MDYVAQLKQGRMGALALEREIGPNLLKGLLISLLIHALVVGSPVVYQLLRGDEAALAPIVELIPPSEIYKLLPQWDTEPQVAIQPSVPNPAQKVIPVPVPAEPTEAVTQQAPSQDDIRRALGLDPGDAVDNAPIGGNITGTELPLTDDVIPDPGVFVAVEVQPAPLTTNLQPSFPEMARLAGVEGKVVAQMYVDRFGNVKKWQIAKVSPQGLGFEEEVLKVIPTWKFTPAIQGERPVGVWVAVPFNFRMKH